MRAMRFAITVVGLGLVAYAATLRQANAELERELAELQVKKRQLEERLDLIEKRRRFLEAAPYLGDYPSSSHP